MISRLLLFVLLHSLCAALWATPVRVGTDIGGGEFDLTGHVELFKDESRLLTVRDITARQAEAAAGGTTPLFRPASPSDLHPGYSQSAFWLKIEIVNASNVFRRLRFVLPSPRLQQVDFFLKKTDVQDWAHAIAGAGRPLREHTRPFRQPLLDVDLAPGQAATVLARIAGSNSIELEPRLYLAEKLLKEESFDALVNGALIGALLMLSAFSLIFALISRDWTPSWLAAGFGLLALYGASNSGLAKIYLWPDSVVLGSMAQGLLGFVVVLVLIYILCEMAPDDERSRRRLRIALAWGGAAMCAAIFLDYRLFALVGLYVVPVVAALLWARILYLSVQTGEGKWIVATGLLAAASMWLRTMDLLGLLPGIDVPGSSYVLGCLCVASALVTFAWWANRNALRRRAADRSLIELQATQQARLREEIEHQTAALNLALAKAKEANQKQRRILAYIGHDLRAPLATIVGYARLLQGMPTSRGPQHARIIERSAHYQLSLIDDLVEYVGPHPRPLGIEAAPEFLPRLLDDVSDAASALAAEHDNRFLLDKGSPYPEWATLDGKRMRQALINLISNAAKFTRKGVIRLKVGAQPKGRDWLLRFEVSDTGAGISVVEQRKLAERLDVHDGESMGLGLFIVRRIVEGMGGRLGLTSTLGIGSSFFFEVVVPAAEDASPQRRDDGRNPTARDEGVVDELRERVLPPREALCELARLADQGEVTLIEEWMERMASLGDHESYLQEIETALHALDLRRIAQLASVTG